MSGSESITIARTAAITTAVMSLPTTFGAFLLLCMSENLLYRVDRVRHRRPHPVRKFHAGAQVGGLARHDQAAAWVAAHRSRIRPGTVVQVEIHHDAGCPYPEGGECHCAGGPEIKIIGEDPGAN